MISSAARPFALRWNGRAMRHHVSLKNSAALQAALAIVAVGALAACASSTASTATTAASNTTSGAGAPSTAAGAATTVAPTQAPSSGPLKACDLLTLEEAAAALGVPLTAGEAGPDGSSCQFTPADLSAGALTGVSFSLDDKAAFDTAKGSGAALQAKITPVSGLGDDAFTFAFLAAGGGTAITGTQLWVLKGATSILLSVNKKATDDSGIVAIETALATTILSRLH